MLTYSQGFGQRNISCERGMIRGPESIKAVEDMAKQEHKTRQKSHLV